MHQLVSNKSILCSISFDTELLKKDRDGIQLQIQDYFWTPSDSERTNKAQSNCWDCRLRSGDLEHFPVCVSVFAPDGQPIERICKQFWDHRTCSRLLEFRMLTRADANAFCTPISANNDSKWILLARLRATQKDKNREHGLWETNSESKDNWKPKLRIRLIQ